MDILFSKVKQMLKCQLWPLDFGLSENIKIFNWEDIRSQASVPGVCEWLECHSYKHMGETDKLLEEAEKAIFAFWVLIKLSDEASDSEIWG